MSNWQQVSNAYGRKRLGPRMFIEGGSLLVSIVDLMTGVDSAEDPEMTEWIRELDLELLDSLGPAALQELLISFLESLNVEDRAAGLEGGGRKSEES